MEIVPSPHQGVGGQRDDFFTINFHASTRLFTNAANSCALKYRGGQRNDDDGQRGGMRIAGDGEDGDLCCDCYCNSGAKWPN